MVHVPYFCIFAIRENEILISMTYDSLFFFSACELCQRPHPPPQYDPLLIHLALR